MRIYLACTVRGSRAGVAAARLIAERLRALGHEVLTEHLLADNVDTAESSLDERAVFDRDRRWLDDCEALVAEASGSTYGVGFEVGYVTARAERTGQAVFLLYDAARTPAISRMISGYRNGCGRTMAYRNLDEVREFIDREFGPESRGRNAGSRVERDTRP